MTSVDVITVTSSFVIFQYITSVIQQCQSPDVSTSSLAAGELTAAGADGGLAAADAAGGLAAARGPVTAGEDQDWAGHSCVELVYGWRQLLIVLATKKVTKY